MKPLNENDILNAVKKKEPHKKRVTFFITEESKSALALWCKKNSITESGAIEEMIRATVPAKFLKER